MDHVDSPVYRNRSGAETPPLRESSGDSVRVSRTRTGAETPPLRESSGDSVRVVRTRSGAETPPLRSVSGESVDVVRTRSGAHTPPLRSTSGDSVAITRSRSGAETPPLRSTSGDSVFIDRTRSGAETPPPRQSSCGSDGGGDGTEDEVVFEAGFHACEAASPKRTDVVRRRRKSNAVLPPTPQRTSNRSLTAAGSLEAPGAPPSQEGQKRQNSVVSAFSKLSGWSPFKRSSGNNTAGAATSIDANIDTATTTLAVGDTFNESAEEWMHRTSDQSVVSSPTKLITEESEDM